MLYAIELFGLCLMKDRRLKCYEYVIYLLCYQLKFLDNLAEIWKDLCL